MDPLCNVLRNSYKLMSWLIKLLWSIKMNNPGDLKHCLMDFVTDQCAKTVCPDPRRHCRVVEGSPICECNEICTADWNPVCGSDGTTYPNECSLEVEACRTGKNLTVVKQGQCGMDFLTSNIALYRCNWPNPAFWLIGLVQGPTGLLGFVFGQDT